MNVWTYWECPYCKSIIHGKYRSCKNCGSPIPNNVKYLMPDEKKVQDAIKNNEVLYGEYEKFEDEKGNKSEVVPESEVRLKPNWTCDYCGYQNFDSTQYCEGCGAPKSNINYFQYYRNLENKKKKDNTDHRELSYKKESKITSKNINNDDRSSIYDHYVSNPYKAERKPSRFNFSIEDFKIPLIILASIIGFIFLIWLFTPITRNAVIEGFTWERVIDIEEFTLCREDDWSIPPGAKVTDERQEIHHYDRVIDHYETKTRQVSHQVLDGYDTHYQDLGNGQARTVQTPRYKTVYTTETYQEPVYKSVPVYRTKYYYDIGRWKIVDKLTTMENDKDPYWYITELPTNIDNPNYGDRKQGSRIESYIAIVRDEAGKIQTKSYDYDEWKKLNINDKIQYKSFRFSYKPL